MQPEVVIYSTPTCTYCGAAKRWFREHGVQYTEHDVTRDPARASEMYRLTGQNAVPVIRVGGQVMVGFDPLQLARLLPANPEQDGQPEAAGERVSLGMSAQSLTSEKASELGLPAAFGVVVGPVKPAGPADAAGIREGDVLTGIGSYTLQNLPQLQRVVAMKRPGDSLAVRAWRSGDEFDATIRFPPSETAVPATAKQQPLQA
ncbi:MAG TPA: Uxx-star family glutaredoxin-like (seleno)protein [Candidatus Dormibacteraeota bacterium]|nr:Uxx-star family glutaredoxin-like (seleno)protein [Candidatus Dormibacteraeota bacterium]